MTETNSKCKDSKSEWIGKIPITWSMATVRNGYEVTLGKMVQPEPKSSTDVLVPYLKAMNVQDGYIKIEKIEKMYASKNELEVYKISKGDLLVCEGGEVARSTIVEDEYDGYVFQNSIHRVKAKKDNNIEYLHYLLIALRNSGFINILVNKATIAHFTKDKFNSLIIPLPTSEEQKEIVLYVEAKEKEISRLIKQKHQLITLLEEKRQSIITEAVTKGLNPNVKMKHSGVEWIGEIPEDWQVKKVKHFSEFVGSGKTPSGGSEVYLEEGIPFLRSLNVHFDGIRLKNLAFISEETDAEMRSSRIQPLDNLLNITGASIGRSCIVPKDFGQGNVNQHVCIIRVDQNKINPYYFNSILNSKLAMEQVMTAQTGSSREGLNFQQVKNLMFPVAPLEEQEKLNQFIFDH
ncbi:restriction endonuclease subunit S [Planococcus sp. 107-1]|uniref:restriction endonuclease subunit S n=1 Tax=Planococcus sp. 107-1 TaxID=2908840 RepID=UPI001F41BC25|nr:restriction endonuclease subunit S [Planococcus sp. 107-1]UJF27935.1 restriction endonuclease subunit S [Planococcus sp. 107-1]